MQTDTIAKDYFAFVQSHRNKESITNLTATFPLLQDWVKAGANIVFGQRSAIVLQKDTENILRLFFFVENADAMHEAFALVPKTQRDVKWSGGMTVQETRLQRYQQPVPFSTQNFRG